jgi:queuine/archaeosine tRNA-ribosyltransferase
VAWTIELMNQMRRAIVDGSFESFRAETLAVWGNAMGSATS